MKKQLVVSLKIGFEQGKKWEYTRLWVQDDELEDEELIDDIHDAIDEAVESVRIEE